MSLSKILKKQGGFSLIKQYIRGGAFFSSVGEVLLLGKSKKALEILRLSAQFKIKKKLEKTYKSSIDSFMKDFKNDLDHIPSNKVWICWFQGLDQAPDLVIQCIDSLKKNLPNKEIIIITADNMQNYVDFPEFIYDKWKNGQITHTHMTDLLRLELLIKYGGTWIDSTVLCTENEENIPDYFFNSDLFFYQINKPGKDGQAIPISSWFLSAKTNNKVLLMTRFLCYEYWKRNNQLVDYFLFHHFFTISLEYNEESWKNVIPRESACAHYLLLRLFDTYNNEMWESIKNQSPFHKLSYKFDNNLASVKNTYYDVLLNKKDDCKL